MEGLILLIFWIILFASAVYGGYWVCEKFKMPLPVFWLVGALFLVILLYFVVSRTGGAHFSWPK